MKKLVGKFPRVILNPMDKLFTASKSCFIVIFTDKS